MGLGGVAIATLPSVIFPKLMFSDRLGGVTSSEILSGHKCIFYESKKYHNYSIDGCPRTVIMRL